RAHWRWAPTQREIFGPERARDEARRCWRTADRHGARRQESDRRRVEIGAIERNLRRELVRDRTVARDERVAFGRHSRMPNDGGRRDPDERRIVDRRVARPCVRPLAYVVERGHAARERRDRQPGLRERDRLVTEIPQRLADRRTIAQRTGRDPEIGGGIEAEYAGPIRGLDGRCGTCDWCGHEGRRSGSAA